MPLTTNNCTRHGGHVEERCPECEAEAYANNLEDAREFMRKNSRAYIQLRMGKQVSVGQLFQYFRALILEELNNGE